MGRVGRNLNLNFTIPNSQLVSYKALKPSSIHLKRTSGDLIIIINDITFYQRVSFCHAQDSAGLCLQMYYKMLFYYSLQSSCFWPRDFRTELPPPFLTNFYSQTKSRRKRGKKLGVR
jgi:hypothetical protein